MMFMLLWVTKNVLYDIKERTPKPKASANWTVISSQGPKAINEVYPPLTSFYGITCMPFSLNLEKNNDAIIFISTDALINFIC